MHVGRSHSAQDGGFSVERKGIKSMRAHLAHRELLKRGNEQDLDLHFGRVQTIDAEGRAKCLVQV